jgi:hypothetical protein
VVKGGVEQFSLKNGVTFGTIMTIPGCNGFLPKSAMKSAPLLVSEDDFDAPSRPSNYSPETSWWIGLRKGPCDL